MPTFNPPLARETSIPISSFDADRFVHLHFTVAFEPTEDASGTWELWTDIADLNADGQVITQPGEWRSVDFVPKQPITPNNDGGATHDDATDESTPIIKLTSTPTTPPTLPAHTELVADMIVPAHNASYAYTYRRVTTSGETHWLGNGGDNGVVRIFEGEKITPQPQVKEWEGIGIEIPTDGGAPVIHHLPSEGSTHASVVLLRSTTPLTQPIHRLADTSAKHDAITHSSLVILSNKLHPVPVEAKATSPTASGIKLFTDEHRSVAALFRDASRDQTLLQSSLNEETDEVVSFRYCPPGTPTTSYLVVYASGLAETRTITPFASSLGDSKKPLAISTDCGRHRFVDADEASKAQIQLPAGKIASIVHLTEFTELEHDNETSWIAGMMASSQEIKEEQIPIPISERKEPIKPQQIEHVEIAPNFTPMSKSGSSQSIAESETSTIGSEGSVARNAADTASFLQFLRKFFFSLWSWLFTPFGHGTTTARTTENVGSDDASSASSTGLLTPHERTPLLDSPGTSQATSSTAVSPFTTPKTGGLALAKTLSDSSATTDVSSPATPVIRKYAQFNFEQAPLHLLFAPGFGSRIHQDLLLRSRRSGDKDWTRHDIKPSAGGDGHCEEVVLEQEQDQAGPWEVQVEFQS